MKNQIVLAINKLQVAIDIINYVAEAEDGKDFDDICINQELLYAMNRAADLRNRYISEAVDILSDLVRVNNDEFTNNGGDLL